MQSLISERSALWARACLEDQRDLVVFVEAENVVVNRKAGGRVEEFEELFLDLFYFRVLAGAPGDVEVENPEVWSVRFVTAADEIAATAAAELVGLSIEAQVGIAVGHRNAVNLD